MVINGLSSHVFFDPHRSALLLVLLVESDRALIAKNNCALSLIEHATETQ
jgi:hypothetical protein